FGRNSRSSSNRATPGIAASSAAASRKRRSSSEPSGWARVNATVCRMRPGDIGGAYSWIRSARRACPQPPHSREADTRDVRRVPARQPQRTTPEASLSAVTDLLQLPTRTRFRAPVVNATLGVVVLGAAAGAYVLVGPAATPAAAVRTSAAAKGVVLSSV